MSTNEFFRDLWFSNEDEDLLEDLLIESIQIYGIDCEYIPYVMLSEDRLYGEDQLLEYVKAYPMEMYMESVTGFEGQGDFLQKFGLQIEDKANLSVSMSRFRHCVQHTLYRPREKDLIYFPLTDSLYEITYVEHEKPFHQLGMISNELYSLRIDLMNYSNQRIRTGVRYIDRFENERAFAVKFTMGTGTGRYLIGETIYQGADLATSTAKATVIHYDRNTKILVVKDLLGNFNNTLTIKGNTSGVEYTIAHVDEEELPNEPTSDNKPIKNEIVDVVNWDEKNPFGEPTK